ncbi:hypothetical protein [Komagataeibacter xylinus]|uniref:hypothetical protein n=1 Tax=Komagataeibacter xylinus TaxID=28448 RepID=UPI00280BA051|nr:hypothetical protein [Komagataeibacter xylinus]
MRKGLFMGTLLLACPLYAHAAQREWKGTTEGTTSATIKYDTIAGTGSVQAMGQMCFASLEGKAVPTANGFAIVAHDGNTNCKLGITLNAQGDITSSDEGPGCITYHGASCSFDVMSAHATH